MARPELGTKYVCESCGAKYYDLNRPNPTCPKCGEPANGTIKAAAKVEEFEDPIIDESQVDGTVSEDLDDEDSDVEEITMDDESAEARLIEASDLGDDGDVDIAESDLESLGDSELPDDEVEVGVSFASDDDDADLEEEEEDDED